MESHNYALKIGNLVYGFLEDSACLGFISFQSKEERLKAGEPLIPVSINISRTDLAVKDFPKLLDNAVQRHRLPAGLFSVEITESVPVKDPKLLANAIASFHQDGYPVWMDDFGSGYSSLNVLHDYPFDLIKFDLVFLRRNLEESSKLIISSCVDMEKRLGIHTLAEDVETQEQLDFLKSIGVEKIQGYYYSKPIPYSELQEKLKNHTFEVESEEERKMMEKAGQAIK